MAPDCNRCALCNKALKMMSVVCKCGSVFCLKHRYPESHSCTFDYKANAKLAISAANPKILSIKVADI